MSLASVVITSVVFAFLQYSEIATKERVEELKKTLADSDIYGYEDASLRLRYDPLINYAIGKTPYLKGVLYALLVALTLLHALHAQDLTEGLLKDVLDQEKLDHLVSYSWWPVSGMVVVAGVRMLWAAIQVSKFRAKVESFMTYLAGFRDGRNK